MAKRRKVGNLMALVVLATLAERPSHPYELASLLRERGKDQDLKIKWGSLYTVVQNLEKHGFIAATESVRQGRRPERTVYAVTQAGLAELVDWMHELIAVPEREHTRFQAALSVLPVLGPDEVMELLRRRAEALDAQIGEQRSAVEESGRELPRLFLVEAEYELALRTAELAWVRGFLHELTSGVLPGVADWRRFHQTGEMPPELAEMAERGRIKE
ncbi:MAG: PadR family transcriptional regulator [Actinobacteria bacterium 13_2_20CM_2_72_6]|nr:MAG: PadR family transcriptional regulator [Actinobacteria bacterium 13_2_20CM_2_72_6]